MLCFDIRSLAMRAENVDGSLSRDDEVWQEGDIRPADSIAVTGRISPAGDGRFYWTGSIAGEVELECRRCLEPVRQEVEDSAGALFAEEGIDEVAEDPDVYPLSPRAGELDLRPAVREQWLLIAPQFALCREDCKGLCLTCGADLNAGDCNCAPAADSRWDALRAARPD
jgi:uncharacterized protein